MNYGLQGLLNATETPEREGEQFRHLVIGSREAIVETIHTLHALGYAEAGAWSPLLPVPNSNEVMSILTRHRSK